MTIKKILTALTLLFLISTLFVGAVSATTNIVLFPYMNVTAQDPDLNPGDRLVSASDSSNSIVLISNGNGGAYFTGNNLIQGTYTKGYTKNYDVYYPDAEIKITVVGLNYNANDRTISKLLGLKFTVTPLVNGYYPESLWFTTPSGGQMAIIGSENSAQDYSVNPSFIVNTLDGCGVEQGLWKVQAKMKSSDFMSGAPLSSGKEYRFTVATIPNSFTLDKDTIIRGRSFLATVAGTPTETVDVIINSEGLYLLDSQIVVDYESSEKWSGSDSYKKVSVVIPSSGQATIQFDTKMDTNPQRFHLTAKFSEEDKSGLITVKRGYVEINSDFNSYYKGNAIKVSGTNTESNSVYLYIIGSDNKLKEILLDNGAYLGKIDVSSDQRWSKEFKLSDSFANGEYIVHASSNPYEYTADGKPYVTANENYAYSTDTFEIKNPSLTASISENTILAGDDIEISGTTEDIVGIVSYYIVGQNMFQWGFINVDSDGSFSETIDTSDFTIGEYSVIIQNPSYDKVFNVKAGVDNYDNEVTNYYNTVSSFATDEYGFIITPANDVVSSINTLSTQNAVDAICGLINKDYVDDIYKVVNFDVSNSRPISTIDSISIKQGWNFISIPQTLDSSENTASKVFEGIDTDGKSILGYNAQTKTWEALKENTQIKPLTGYWIYSKTDDSIELTYTSDPATPPAKSVYEGWNAVGLSENEATPAQNALAGTKWVKVRQWNIENKNYDTAITKTSSPDQLIQLKNGYWLYVESDGTLV